MVKKTSFTPVTIDSLAKGSRADPLTPGLAIEVLPSGKKRWYYRRKIAGQKIVATLFGGLYPSMTIADARSWARELNEQVEMGTDPRVSLRKAEARAQMTVAFAHGLYMTAVTDGRTSRRKRTLKPNSIKLKLGYYRRDIAPKFANRSIYDITEDELIELVEAKGKTAKVGANRLAAELRVFFGWACSLTGKEIGLSVNPAARLRELRFPQEPRSRILSSQELEWFLQALVDEPRHFQRGLLLCLLTAARISEVAQAKSEEYSKGLWTIPAARVKNSREHKIELGPWGQSLIATSEEWVFQSELIDGPRGLVSWYRARDRMHKRMEKIASQPIKPFAPHDFRRTARSNTKRLQVDYETAEAMLNHTKQGMERVYDLYELEEEKRLWFRKWENEIIGIAERVGVANALGAPIKADGNGYSFNMRLPKRPGLQPTLDFGSTKPGTIAKFAQPTAKVVFTWEPRQAPLPEAVDLLPRQPR